VQALPVALAATLLVNLQPEIKPQDDGTPRSWACAPLVFVYYVSIVASALASVWWNAERHRHRQHHQYRR
jgi:hypothetical protein